MLDGGHRLKFVIYDSLLHCLLLGDKDRTSALNCALFPDRLLGKFGCGVKMAVRVLVEILLEGGGGHLDASTEASAAASLIDCLVEEIAV